MTENQELRKLLLEKSEYNMERAKEAYDFIIGNKSEVIKHHKDGVYLRYEDGHEEWFNGKNKKENVAGVAVHLGERHTCIAKFDVEDNDGIMKFCLLKNNDDDTEEYNDTYIMHYFNAYNDLNGKNRTKRLIRRGCKIPLAEKQYIPSVGEWMLILMFLKKVQESLDYVHGEMLKDDWYWSSTECASFGAWNIFVGNGNIYGGANNSKEARVRPCLK